MSVVTSNYQKQIMKDPDEKYVEHEPDLFLVTV